MGAYVQEVIPQCVVTDKERKRCESQDNAGGGSGKRPRQVEESTRGGTTVPVRVMKE